MAQSRLRRALRRFRRRGHSRFCLCFKSDRLHDSSAFFQDIPGVIDPKNPKKVSDSNPRIFSYSELYIGSNGFSDKEVLGVGGFGRVYRAVLPSDDSVVAVKCVAGADGKQSLEKTFAAELVAVARLRHRNLVRLRGWCVHAGQLLLVYDYMPNRSLDRVLFSPAPALAWELRRRVVEGLAAALFYLHDQLDTQIIHRDVKTSNVMLDAGFNARLGDFGLARWVEHGEDVVGFSARSVSASNYQFRLSETSRIGGTIGYLPPESFHRRGGSGGATARSDVFSFGVVVLEVATGRRAVDLTYPDEQIFMLDWVRRLADEGRFLDAADPRLLDGSYSLAGMRRLLHLGLLCSLHDPKSRPTMKWVVEVLTGDLSGELPAFPSFKSHPQYISLSSSSTATIVSSIATLSSFVTAGTNTVFLTADDGDTATGKSNSSATPFPDVDTAKEISFEQILAITGNFSESQMVAELDFGTGYCGYLDNRHHVLVKRLGMKTCPALRTRFSDELHNLGRLRHRNLVQLRGWCTEHGEMLVVYDYPSSSGVLSHHLFCHKSPVLRWHHRWNIIKSLASAVLYLHEEWDEQVIHRNITSSAVFLDPDMSPRLGCFALAEFLSRGHGHHASSSAAARGIFGYMSPECLTTGQVTTMADVYSFGMVVLEVVTGRMAVDFRCPEVLLVRKVRDFEAGNGQMQELADRRMDEDYDRREVVRMVRLGIACTQSRPEARPSMRQIASILEGNDELLKMFEIKKEGKEEWERMNASSLKLVRSIQALGIQ